MMTLTSEPGRHLDDADILCFMDGEGEPAELEAWRAHVCACEQCAGEVAALRNQSDFVSGWLARVPVPLVERPAPVAVLSRSHAPPAPTGEADAHAHRFVRGTPASARAAGLRMRGTPWLRAAAAILLLAGPLAAIPPLRDWVGERLGLAPAAEPSAAPRTPATNAAADVGPAATALRFVPAPGTFHFDMDALPGGGTLTLGRGAGSEAVLEVLGSGAAGGVTVSDGGVRVRGGDGEATSYVLRVPAGTDAVVLRVAGFETERIDRRGIDAMVTVQLRAR
jgi:hypothetical protein